MSNESNITKIVIYIPCVEIYEVPREVLENVSDEELEAMSDEELALFVKDNVDYLGDYYEGTEDSWDEQDYAILVKK